MTPTPRRFPNPGPPPDAGSLPHPVTFFLSRAQRDAVLRVLRARVRARREPCRAGWRARALLLALSIDPDSPDQNRTSRP